MSTKSNSVEIFDYEEFQALKEQYTKKLDEKHIERPKCRCCGGEIFYLNSKVNIGPKAVTYAGTTCNSKKVVNGTTYKLEVCRDCFVKKFPEFTNKKRPPFNVMCEGTKWAFNISDEDYSSVCESYAMTEKHMIEKYGEEAGKAKWDAYCKQQALTNTFEYKQKKYGMSREEFNEYNKSRAVTLENLIKRHGKEKGKKIWKNYCEQQKITKSWDYMVNKFGEEKAREINQKKINNEANYIRKYGEQEGRARWKRWVLDSQLGYSKISQEIFKEIDNILPKELRNNTMYATKNGEFYVKGKLHTHMLDYFIPQLNINIEFNGDIWHANPIKYKASDKPNPYAPNLTAQDIWDREKSRISELKNEFNIKTYIIWENDWKHNNFDLIDFVENILEENNYYK